jgi:GT2 family glycosyltransferase
MLSICIVSWNTRALLKECLRAIAFHRPAEEYEVIVVDNASPDASAQMVKEEFPEVRLIENCENLFYAKANNQAFAIAKGDLLMLLNPDTEVKKDCLNLLSTYLRSNPQTGAIAPRLLFPDGLTQPSCRSFPTPRALLLEMLGLSRLLPGCRFCGEYRMSYFQHDSVSEVDQPMASALMLKREAIEQIGVFDEGFPMFFNDVDLCLRLKQADWKIIFHPEAQVVHHHGASTAQRKQQMIAQSHDSLARFYSKHYLGRVSWAGYWSVLGLSKVARQIRLLLSSK